VIGYYSTGGKIDESNIHATISEITSATFTIIIPSRE
jgi:hypothetical protein